MISERQVNELLDDLMVAIEDAIEDAGLDIDYETAAGILTLEFEDGSQIILSRQAAMAQLWMAARSGGFHFDYDESSNQWLGTRDAEPFKTMLNRCCSEQAGEPIELVW